MKVPKGGNEWRLSISNRVPRVAPRETRLMITLWRITPTNVLATFKTQREAIEWAKKNRHIPHVARVRHLNDKKKADHWRAT